MPLYRTRLFEMGPWETQEPPFHARGWRALYRYMEANSRSPDLAVRASREHEALDVHHHIPSIVHSEDLPDGTKRIVYAPEIIIEARTRLAAQRAANLIAAA